MSKVNKIGKESKDQLSVANFLNELSMVVQAEHNLTQAIELCKEALEIALEYDYEIPTIYHQLSILYQENGQFEEAKEILEVLRETYEARHDLSGLGKALNELGLVHASLGELVRAANFFRESIILKHRIGDKRGIHTTFSNLQKCVLRQPQVLNDPKIIQTLSDPELVQILKNLGK